MKIVATVIKNGKRPLQGTNAFVTIAIIFSLGESIILHPNYSCSITTKSHAHGSNNRVVFESADKCGTKRKYDVKFDVYFRV